MNTEILIMVIVSIISSCVSGRYLSRGNTVEAIYYELLSLGLLIMIILMKVFNL